MPTIRERNGKFQVQVRAKRKGRIVHQESNTFDTYKQAMLWGLNLEKKLAGDGWEQRVKDTVTLGVLVEKWIEAKEERRPMSRGIQHSVTAIMSASFINKAVGSVTSSDITSWARKMQGSLAPSTILHHLMVLRSGYSHAKPLFNVAADVEVVAEAGAALKQMKITAKSTSRDRRITDAELDAIELDLKAKFIEIPTDVFVRLAVALPRRREELLTMTWADYDAKKGTVLLRDTKSPGEVRDELVPVPPAAQKIIDGLPRIDERILPYKPESVSAAFQRCVRRLGLEDIRLHDLRHEGISRLFEAGLQIQEVAMISGHTNWSTLRRYTHLKPAQVLEKLSLNRKGA